MASGWFYRVNGVDERERPLPPPESEGWNGRRFWFSWSNFAGTGLSLYETGRVLDGERPSGGYLGYLSFSNATSVSVDLTIFHYLDASAAGTPGGDLGGHDPIAGGLTFEEGATSGIYRALGTQAPARRMVRPYPELLDALNDAQLTELDDTGVPFGPGNWTAAHEWRISMPPGDVVNLGVLVSSRLSQRVKGDFDGDGFADLLFREPDTGRWRQWPLQRTEALSSIPTHLLGHGLAVAVDDFTGDGVSDVVRRDDGGGIWFHDVANLASVPLTGAALPPLNWNVVASADFDHDGHPDLLWQNDDSRKLVVWTMNGAQQTGALVPNPNVAPAGAWVLVGARDFDADGAIDLLWHNRSSGNVVVWYLDETLTRIRGGLTVPPGVPDTNWRLVATADFGKGLSGVWGTPDLLWRHALTGRLVVWHMDSTARRTQGVFLTPADTGNASWELVGPR